MDVNAHDVEALGHGVEGRLACEWSSTGVLGSLFSEVHSVCALQQLGTAGASGLDLCLGLRRTTATGGRVDYNCGGSAGRGGAGVLTSSQ